MIKNGRLGVFLCVKELVLFEIEVGFGKVKWYDVVKGFLKWWKSAEYLRRFGEEFAFGTVSEETDVGRVSMRITNLVRNCPLTRGNEGR